MHPYHQQGIEWAGWLSACSDDELMANHNRAVDVRCFGCARQMYLRCLEQELLAREFDSSALFARDSGGKVSAYRLSFTVGISEIDGRRALVEKPDTPEHHHPAS